MDTLRIKLVALISYACLVSAGFFTLYSCNNRKLQESTPEEIAQYVEAYTASVVKRNSTIQVVFNENAEPALAGSSRILKFSYAPQKALIFSAFIVLRRNLRIKRYQFFTVRLKIVP